MEQNQNNKISEHNFLNLVLVLVKWRMTIFIIIFASIIVGITIAFLIPRQYKSIARVLPPKESTMLSGFSGLSNLVRSLPSGLTNLGKFEDPFNYIALLRSRTVMEEIIVKFNLQDVYEISDRSLEKTLKILKNNTEIDWTEENTLEIRVWDYDAQLGADITNFYIEMLNKRSFELQTQEARNTRTFLEQRVRQNKDDLYQAEQNLKEYQEKEKIIVALDPSTFGLSPVAEVYAQKVKKELELNILRQTIGKNHPQYIMVRRELQNLESKISRFPEIGIESIRLYREILIQQKIMELIVPLYEQVKVNENKDIPVAYILDPAVPGERPDRPKRLFILGILTFLGAIFSFIFIGYKEYLSNLKENQPEQWKKVLEVKQSLKVFKKLNAK